MNVLDWARGLLDRVTGFRERARKFYYAVMLLGHACPKCGGTLKMVREGRCACSQCGHEFDPTCAFQPCAQCGGAAVLRLRRYQCRQCGADVPSRFHFDGLVFDPAYFQQKMAEHRQRKKELREQVRDMLAECRSPVWTQPAAAALKDAPGLVEALDSLTIGVWDTWALRARDNFDFKRYQQAIQAQLGENPICLDDIPALVENRRKDRAWRFVTVLFMAHHGLIRLWQEGPTIWVSRYESH